MLEGLKVVELATYIAAPGAGAIMADWGASVVKIESPKGDPMRLFFDAFDTGDADNPVFDMDNRGKRGVVLDITKPEGREAALRLVREADVFLTNNRPGSLSRSGFDYENLRKENPRLIYASLTGYGLEGPDIDKAGMDVASYWARSGVAAATTPKGVEPFPIRTAMGDHITSMATVSAVLAAVFEQQTTGQGRLVETSLLRTGVYSIASDMSIQLRFGKLASTRPRHAAVNPLANFFKTSDGRWICLLVRTGGTDWPQIATAVGHPEWIEDPRFLKNRDRRVNGAALVTLMDEAIGAMDIAELTERFDAQDLTWAPVQTPREVIEDPQAIAAGCFVDIPDGKGGFNKGPASPARFPGAEDGPRGPAPKLGEHTDAVLAELGYGADEIADLKASGAAG
ncbi:CoA transferase [Caulobacter sp. SLTY]|uniref:CoA transferase n=1 Tax=Caulobacter sp. SLTY TaxID=2683262 RepID=UPI001412610F|nr:CoA transferase [Caulobacter sp. SLTY]